MRVLKDTPLELGWVTWQVRPPATTLVCVVKATFDIVQDGACPLSDEQAAVTGDLFWEDDPTRSVRYDSDLAIGKPCGEWFATGTWRAAAGRSVRHHVLTAGVGGQRKRLALIGARHWGRMGGLTDPQPFSELPLAWELAFGGREIAANPVGLGVAPDPTDAEGRVRLPSIEDPDRLIGSRDDRPPPASLGPIPRTFASRASLTGTYDADYLATRWPYFPADFRWEHFLAAPPERRKETFFRGDERIELEGGHPDLPVARCRLPGIQPRLFLCAVGQPPGSALVDVALVLDTIVIDLDGPRVHAVWRGFVEGVDEALSSLSHAFLVHEPRDQPRSPEEHRESFERKLREEDEEDEAFEAQAPEEPAPEALAPEAPEVPLPDPLEARRAQREDLLREGMPPEMVDRLVPLEVPAAPPLDPAATAAREAAGHAAAVAALRELGRDDVATLLEEERAEEMARDAQEPAPPAEGPVEAPVEAPTSRVIVERALAEGTPLAGMVLAGADLSGLDLSKRDLAGCVLTGASLVGTDLRGACLDGASLDGARVDDARFDGASLKEAHLDGMLGVRASFRGAILEDAHGEGVALPGADFRNCLAARVELPLSNLEGALFERAILDEAELSGSNLQNASFIDASLADARLDDGATAARACFEGANAPLLRASESDFRECSFKWAKLDGARFGSSWVDRSNFSFCSLPGADFSGASLTEAVMLSVDAPDARFADASMVGVQLGRANLLRARLEGANLHHADLRGANLYGAELWRARIEDARFELANLRGTKLEGT